LYQRSEYGVVFNI